MSINSYTDIMVKSTLWYESESFSNIMYEVYSDDNNTTVRVDNAPMRDEWLAMPVHYSALSPAGCSNV